MFTWVFFLDFSTFKTSQGYHCHWSSSTSLSFIWIRTIIRFVIIRWIIQIFSSWSRQICFLPNYLFDFCLLCQHIIWGNPTGSENSTLALIHGNNRFMNVSSITLFERSINGTTSRSNKFLYSSTVEVCLIAKNLPYNEPSQIDRNCSNNLLFKSNQPLNLLRSPWDR